MEEYEPKSGLITVIGVVSALLLIVLILFLEAIHYRAAAKEELRKAVMVPAESRAVFAEHLAQLEGYRVIDPQKGVVSVPIDRAMDLVLAEYGGQR